MTTLLIACLRLYQVTLSPDHGIFSSLTLAGCRFRPTCSDYAIAAIRRDGPRRGVLLAVRRVLRCHPWSRGGIDPLPLTEKLP